MNESLRILMTGLIDYAGLFPPASLSMKSSVNNFHAYRRGEHAWMPNRFVLPVAQLQTFLFHFKQLANFSETGVPWKLSAIAGSDFKSDIAAIVQFNQQTTSEGIGAMVDSVEMKIASPGEVCEFVKLIPAEIESYFEITDKDMTEDCIQAIAHAGSCAKIRAGGATADMYPSCREVVRFLAACAFAGVAFKASAGLHHALRDTHRYTYESDSPAGMMHGFLNLFAAAAFAWQDMDARTVEELLKERSAETFRFEENGICWRGRRITNEEMATARRSFCISFGSCSFDEPIDDLRAFGLL